MATMPRLAELFAHYRKRLRRMVQIRMDRRLLGRVDPSDVLQEAYLDLAKRLPDYAKEQSYPFFLWLRMLTGQRLMLTHRFHLQTAMRDAGQEVSLYHKAMPEANSMSLAANLLGPNDLGQREGHACRSAGQTAGNAQQHGPD